MMAGVAAYTIAICFSETGQITGIGVPLVSST
jgi:hypothetical protein